MCRNMVIVCVVCILLCLAGIFCVPKTQTTNRRVCVIGAGIAGLTSARYLKEENVDFTVLEATRYVGGTWRYDPHIGNDEYGLPLHTSMYKHLRTNLPKPTMQLKDFPLPESIPSFPSWKHYYEYIKDYARHFDLEKHVKFLHVVVSVKRLSNIWKVKHKYLPTGEEFEGEYDYVIIGTGHHSTPLMPNIPGEKIFKGKIIHSHDYREPDVYKGRRVLIVGAGPSGMDISLDVAEVSRTVVHSHHSQVPFLTPFSKNYVKKPDVKEFNETGAVFVDGTFEELDDVIYCTGFQYDYPFLDESCGLSLSPRSVVPLYKYMVNIHHPTMMFMGLVVRACLVVAIEAQARYATAFIKGNFTLPSEAQMLDEWQRKADSIRSRGRPLSDIHFLGQNEDQYYAELTEESGIDRVPPVMFKIRTLDTQAKLENLYTYRDYVYTVLDNENFTRHLGPRINSSCVP